jgi:hypothetical protein
MSESRQGKVALFNNEFDIMFACLIVENELFLSSYTKPIKKLQASLHKN